MPLIPNRRKKTPGDMDERLNEAAGTGDRDRFDGNGARGGERARPWVPEPAGPQSSLTSQPPTERTSPRPAVRRPPQRDTGRWDPIVIDLPTSDVEPTAPLTGRYRVDTEIDGWSTRTATIRMASLRGYKHRYYGRPRQDNAKVLVHQPSDTVLFAVADGVSSAEQAEVGAVIACNASVGMAFTMLDANRPVDWREVLSCAASRLISSASAALGVAQADQAQVEKLFATTLVVGTARPTDGGLLISLCRVGDSGAWVLESTDEHYHYHPIFTPKISADSVVVSNAVRPLPRLPEPVEQQTFTLTPGGVLLVGTDGFGDPLGDGDGQVGALFAEHLAAPPRPLGFAHLLDFSRETFDDDRTLLGIWPRDPGERP
jgi:hypothetical protein